jgi:CRISPR/Cas system-associated protein Csm6
MLYYFSTLFTKKSAEEIVQDTLDNYARQLIEAESQALLSAKMVEFYKDAIKKLNTYNKVANG